LQHAVHGFLRVIQAQHSFLVWHDAPPFAGMFCPGAPFPDMMRSAGLPLTPRAWRTPRRSTRGR
jgi:hypothetical protein